MSTHLLVVARRASALNKFEQVSLSQARNTKDFLEETGEYDEVSIFQQLAGDGPLKEWVKLNELER